MQVAYIELTSNVGFIIEFLGALLVAYTVISVHTRVWKEHKIDEAVFKEMKRERNLGLIGIAFMVIGFILQMTARFYFFDVL
jgi:rRNA processing protein Gar1